MSFIKDSNAKIVNTELTDAGRKMLSLGRFDVKYFQVGDSEVSYSFSGINLTDGRILSPQFNSHNRTFHFNANRSGIKSPLFIDDSMDNVNGIPHNVHRTITAEKNIPSKGFFNLTGSSWNYVLEHGWTVNPNYHVPVLSVSGDSTLYPISGNCITLSGDPTEGCCPPETGTTTTTTTIPIDPCDYTGDTITDICDLSGVHREIGEVREGDLVLLIIDCNTGNCNELEDRALHFMYRICCITNGNFILDRELPSVDTFSGSTYRLQVFSSDFDEFYDHGGPENYWQSKTLTYETSCDIPRKYPKVWNMAIPWSEPPAGVMTTKYKGHAHYQSRYYLGTKGYFGYSETTSQKIKVHDSGNTIMDFDCYYNDSYGYKVMLEPDDQKAIAIIHYTNSGVDFEYGEQFSLTTPENFKVDIPWLMWHNNTGTTIGETFYVKPPGSLLDPVKYSIVNVTSGDEMENLEYYHLWDDNPNVNGDFSRVGKVFPSHKMIIIDDEELVAALSYKANRSWTLPAPFVEASPLNACDAPPSTNPLMVDEDWVWITYLFKNNGTFTNSLHCNYYRVIKPDMDCISANMNARINFASGFNFLSTDHDCNNGFYGESVHFLVQKTKKGDRPSPSKWKIMDLTSQIDQSTIVNGFISQASMTGTSFTIDGQMYDSSGAYDLGSIINIPRLNQENNCMNFGDEVFFYGNVETDVLSNAYEMKYIINLDKGQFVNSSNPTWDPSKDIYLTEVGLLDDRKNLLLTSKLQNPKKREGIQQLSVSFII